MDIMRRNATCPGCGSKTLLVALSPSAEQPEAVLYECMGPHCGYGRTELREPRPPRD